MRFSQSSGKGYLKLDPFVTFDKISDLPVPHRMELLIVALSGLTQDSRQVIMNHRILHKKWMVETFTPYRLDRVPIHLVNDVLLNEQGSLMMAEIINFILESVDDKYFGRYFNEFILYYDTIIDTFPSFFMENSKKTLIKRLSNSPNERLITRISLYHMEQDLGGKVKYE